MPLAHGDLEPTTHRPHIPLGKDSDTRSRVQLAHFISCAQSHLARGGSSQCLAVTRACASKGGQAVLGCQDQSQCVPGLVGGHRMPRCGLQLWPDQRHQNRSPQKLLRLLRQMTVGHPSEDCLCVTLNANPLLPRTQNLVSFRSPPATADIARRLDNLESLS